MQGSDQSLWMAHPRAHRASPVPSLPSSKEAVRTSETHHCAPGHWGEPGRTGNREVGPKAKAWATGTSAATGEQRGPLGPWAQVRGHTWASHMGISWPALHPGGEKTGMVKSLWLLMRSRQSVWKGKGSSLRGTWKGPVNEMGQSTLAAQVQSPSQSAPGTQASSQQEIKNRTKVTGRNHRISQHLQPDSLAPSCAPLPHGRYKIFSNFVAMPHRKACDSLVPWPGIQKPLPLALEGGT